MGTNLYVCLSTYIVNMYTHNHHSWWHSRHFAQWVLVHVVVNITFVQAAVAASTNRIDNNTNSNNNINNTTMQQTSNIPVMKLANTCTNQKLNILSITMMKMKKMTVVAMVELAAHPCIHPIHLPTLRQPEGFVKLLYPYHRGQQQKTNE